MKKVKVYKKIMKKSKRRPFLRRISLILAAIFLLQDLSAFYAAAQASMEIRKELLAPPLMFSSIASKERIAESAVLLYLRSMGPEAFFSLPHLHPEIEGEQIHIFPRKRTVRRPMEVSIVIKDEEFVLRVEEREGSFNVTDTKRVSEVPKTLKDAFRERPAQLDLAGKSGAPEDIVAEEVLYYEKVLRTDGLPAGEYLAAAHALASVVKNSRLSEEMRIKALSSIEKALITEGLDSGMYKISVRTITDIVEKKPEVIHVNTLLSLKRLLKRNELTGAVRSSSAKAIGKIARTRGELIGRSTLSELEKVLYIDDLSFEEYFQSVQAVLEIIKKRNDLITSSTSGALKRILLFENIDSIVYETSAQALSAQAVLGAPFFAQVFEVCEELIAKGKLSKLKKIFGSLPSELPVRLFSQLRKEENWALILEMRGTPEVAMVKKEDLYKLLRAEERFEKLLQAMMIKQKIYCDLTGREKLTFSKEELFFYSGVYKMSWNDYKAFMDKHYDAFHKSPENFIINPLEMELEVFDERDEPETETDIAHIDRLEPLDQIAEAERLLLSDGSGTNDFRDAAGRLAEIALSDRAHSAKAIKTLEGIMNTPNLGSHIYEVSVSAMSKVLKDDPGLFGIASSRAAENILKKEHLDPGAYEASADYLSALAVRRPELISASIVSSLMRVVDEEDFDRFAYDSYAALLSTIAKGRKELAGENLVQVLEKMLNTEDLFFFAYSESADAAISIARERSELLSASFIKALKHALISVTATKNEDCSAVAETIGFLAKANPDLTEEAISALESVLKRPGLSLATYRSCAASLQAITISETVSNRETLDAFERILRTRDLTSEVYGLSAEAIVKIVMAQPGLREEALLSIKRILAFDGAMQAAYFACASAIGSITKTRPDLANEEFVELLEGAFRSDLSDLDAKIASANALGMITGKRPKLIEASTVLLFEEMLKVKGRIPSFYAEYADFLGEVARKRPDLADEAVASLERVVSSSGLDKASYEACIEEIVQLTKRRPDLIGRTALLSLEKALKVSEIEERAQKAIYDIFSSVFWRKSGIFDVFWEMRERALEEGRTELAERIVSSMPDEIPLEIFARIRTGGDWSLILGSISPEEGVHIVKEDLLKIIKKEEQKERTLEAIKFKQLVYCDLSGDKPFSVDSKDVPSLSGIYKTPWEEFARFMDLHYEAFHENAQDFILDPVGMDLSDHDELFPVQDGDMAGKSEAALIKEIRKHAETLKREGQDDATYRASADALSDIALRSRPGIGNMVVLQLSKLVGQEDLSSDVREICINALDEIAMDYSKGMRSSTVNVLENILATPGLDAVAYEVSADFLHDIVIQRAELIIPSTVHILEDALRREHLDLVAVQVCGDTLSLIADKAPVLKGTVIDSLERILSDEGLKTEVYKTCAQVLGKKAGSDPGNFNRMLKIRERFLREENWKVADAFINSLPKEIPVETVSKVDGGEDWPLVLGTISPETGAMLAREELSEILASRSTVDRALKAVKIKQRVYAETRAKRTFTIDEEKLSSYVGVYKFIWEEFTRFMDLHYEAFHEDPENFMLDPEWIDLGDTDLELSEEETDFASMSEKSARKKAKEHQITLFIRGLEEEVYTKSAEFLRDLAKEKTANRSEAVGILRDVMSARGADVNARMASVKALWEMNRSLQAVKPGYLLRILKNLIDSGELKLWHYEICAQKIGEIAATDPEEIDMPAFNALKAVLEKPDLDFAAYFASATSLAAIAEKVEALSDKAVLLLVEKVNIDRLAQEAKAACLKTVSNLARTRPMLLSVEAVGHVEKAFISGEQEPSSLQASAGSLSNLTEKRPGIVSDEVFLFLEQVFSEKDLGHHVPEAGAELLGLLSRERPHLIGKRTLKAFRKILKSDLFSAETKKACSLSLKEAIEKSPEITGRKALSFLNDILSKKDLSFETYRLLALTIGETALTHKALSLRALGLLEEVLRKKDADPDARLACAEAISVLVITSPELSKKALAVFNSVFSKKTFFGEIYEAAVSGIINIADNRPDKLNRSLLSALEDLLSAKKLEHGSFKAASDAIAIVAQKRPDLIRSGTIAALKKVFFLSGLKGLDHMGYAGCADALVVIAKARSFLSGKVVEVFESVLLTEGLEEWVYHDSAAALAEIAEGSPGTIRENTVFALKSVIKREGLHYEANLACSNALLEIIKTRPDLSEKIINFFELLLRTDNLDPNAYKACARALAEIAKLRPEMIKVSVVTSFERILKKSAFESLVYWECAKALGEIARVDIPASSEAMAALELILNTEGLAYCAYLKSVEALGQIAAKKPDLFSFAWRIRARLESEGRTSLAKKIIEEMPGTFPVNITSEVISDENWPLVLGTVDASTGAVLAKSDLKEVLSIRGQRAKTLWAMRVKRDIYCRLKGKEKIPFDETRLPYYSGVYKFPWEEFVRFMDEQYEEFHEAPEKFIFKPFELFINGADEFLVREEDADMATEKDRMALSELRKHENVLLKSTSKKKKSRKSVEAMLSLAEEYPRFEPEVIASLRRIVKEVPFVSYSYEESARALVSSVTFNAEGLEPLWQKRQNLTAEKRADLSERVLKVPDLREPIYLRYALELAQIAKKSKTAGYRAVDSLEKLLKTKGLSSWAYASCAQAMTQINQARPGILKFSAVVSLESVLLTDGLEYNAYDKSAKAMTMIALKDTELSGKVVASIEKVLIEKGVGSEFSRAALYAFSEIIKTQPDLVTQRMFLLLEEVLEKEGLETNFYSFAAYTLALAAFKGPRYFALVWRIRNELIEEGRPFLARWILESFVKALPEDVPVRLFSHVRKAKEDWPLVLGTIKPSKEATIKSERLKKILFSERQAEKTLEAISFKREFYCRSRGKEPGKITERELASYLGIYKFPWQVFVRFMDANYEAFHRDPHSFIQDPILMELNRTYEGVPSEGSNDINDIALELELQRGAGQRPERRPFDANLSDPTAFLDSAGKVVKRIESDPSTLDEFTVTFFEGILTIDDLPGDIYSASAKVLFVASKKRPDLIGESTRGGLEGVLLRTGLDELCYRISAKALASIGNSDTALRKRSIRALERILDDKSRAYYAYSAVAKTIRELSVKSPQKISAFTMFSLERFLSSKYGDSDSYAEAASAVRQITEKSPEVVTISTVAACDSLFKNPALERSTYEKNAFALFTVGKLLPGLREEVINVLESVLQDEHLDPDARGEAARALGMLAGEEPEAFARAYAVLSERKEDRRDQLLEKILEGMPEELPPGITKKLDTGEDWPLVLAAIGSSSGKEIEKEDIESILFAEKEKERTFLAVGIKERVYSLFRFKEPADILESELSSYLGVYKLPWEDFVSFMDENYEDFHSNPSSFIESLLEADLDGSLEEFPQGDQDISREKDFPAGGESELPRHEKVAFALKGSILSAVFSRKMVIGFTEDLGESQAGSPALALRRAFSRLKRVPEYKELLGNLIILGEDVEHSREKIEEYAKDDRAIVFLFSADSEEAEASLSGITGEVNLVRIDSSKFHRRAYYPLVEIVLLTLSEYYVPVLKEGEKRTDFTLAGEALNLSSLNIESVSLEEGRLIFRLLPSACVYDEGELKRIYGKLHRFLSSA